MLGYIFALLISLGWITGEHFPPWVSWHNELWVFAAMLWLAAGGLVSLRNQKIRAIAMPGLAWVGVAFLTVVFVQYTLGYLDFSGDALVIAFYVFLCLLALIAGHHAVPRRNSEGQLVMLGRNPVDFFAVVLLFAAASSAAIALAQAMDVWDNASWITRMPSARRSGGNLGQPNQLATLLLMGLASLVYLFEARRLHSASTIALYFLLMCGMAVSQSRAGLLSLILMIVWWMVRYRSTGSRVVPIAVLTASATLIISFWFWPELFAFVQAGGTADRAFAYANTNIGSRLIVWPQIAEAAMQRPWFGWGLGEMGKAHNAVLGTQPVSEPFTYAHNIVLDLAVGIGLPLTILSAAITTVWLWRRVRRAKDLLPWYCVALVLPFAVHSMLEFPFAYAYFLVPVIFAVGYLEGTLAPTHQVRIGWWPAATIWLVVTTTMAWSALEYIAVEEDFRMARFEASGIGQTPNEYERPKIYLLTQLGALLDSTRTVPTPGMNRQSIELTGKVAMRFPSPATKNRYALSLALNGNTNEAMRQLKVLRAMHGEKAYVRVRANWSELANSQYPQLKLLSIP